VDTYRTLLRIHIGLFCRYVMLSSWRTNEQLHRRCAIVYKYIHKALLRIHIGLFCRCVVLFYLLIHQTHLRICIGLFCIKKKYVQGCFVDVWSSLISWCTNEEIRGGCAIAYACIRMCIDTYCVCMELFCGYIGLICGYVGFFYLWCTNEEICGCCACIRMYLNVYLHVLRMYGAVLRIYRALLRKCGVFLPPGVPTRKCVHAALLHTNAFECVFIRIAHA